MAACRRPTNDLPVGSGSEAEQASLDGRIVRGACYVFAGEARYGHEGCCERRLEQFVKRGFLAVEGAEARAHNFLTEA
jgi:hypothetical protein